jgi:NADPH:quinone reductase-like Zn-dependent oxidoreductase
MLRDEGVVVLCGRSGGEPELASVQPELIGSRRALGLREFHLNGSIMRHFDELPERIGRLLDALAAGEVTVPITAFTLEDAAKAHELLESGASVGKHVLHP